ncbi:hypothetical protein BA065_02500 [Nanoarchaeota archaeon NZ13-N]|nr:MAG: hypothetical protein BA065_02500 [Nanoarchaeota archaeon NZ13-N]
MIPLSQKKREIADILGLSLKELDDLVKQKINEYYGYIDDNTALMIILKENNLDPSILLKVKISDLSYRMKVKRIFVKVGKVLIKKENLLILEVYDSTGKVKLIFKGNYRKIENLLKEGNVVEIRNAIVLKNLTLALFINNDILVREVKDEKVLEEFEKLDYEGLRYVTEFICKVLDRKEDSYEVLTESFNRIYIKTNERLEIGKNYIIKCYLTKPLTLINYKLLESYDLS